PIAVTLAATPENTQASTPAPTLIQVELAESIVLLTPTPVLSATPTTTLTTLLAPTPTPTSRSTTQPWTVVSDGNWMNELVVAGNTIWIASDGGALAWTRGSATPVKFTSINGLTDNRLTAVADCALPELGILFGSNDGLQVVDPRAGGWRQLNSRNSELSYDDISALLCDAEAGYLVIGYARHGIDVFDARTSEWRHLDRNSGLASNNVLDLAVVGALAEIWVAADDGITLAAGPDSTFYNATNSPLESNRIGAIAADPAGGVWVGGDGVLYRIDGERWTIFSAEEVEDDGFPVRLITGLALTDGGDLWLGDIDGAVCRFNPDTATCDEAFRAENGMADAPLTHLSLDADGQVYYTTAGDGFSAYDGTAWKRFFRANEGVLGNSVGAATVDPDGALWVVTDGGVQRIVAPNRPPVLTPDSGIDPATTRAIYAARNGDIWVGGDGVGVWDGERWTRYTADDGLAGNTVQAIAEDSRGRIWLGADAGVSIWNGASFFNLTRDAGLPSDDIRALLADGDAMWIGSAGGGLYRFVRNQLEVFTMDNINLPSDTITALSVGDDELLYVGTDAGLAELRTGLATSMPEIGERAVTQVLVLDDSIWVGTADDGLFYDAGDGWQQETTAGALPSDRVTALASVDGAVWVGGDTGGLVRYLLPTKE
ncbi:MAG: two-component regulator propeller domain-containing protein, partial [Caldilinea sp.]